MSNLPDMQLRLGIGGLFRTKYGHNCCMDTRQSEISATNFVEQCCLVNLPLKGGVLNLSGSMTQKRSKQMGFLISSELT